MAAGVMRRLFMIFCAPLIQSCLQMLHAFKDFPVKQFSTKDGMEVFYTAVLSR